MTSQLLLPLSLKPLLRAEDFRVGESNKNAWTWVEAWPQWPTPGLVIYGPPGCGKTHLGKVFEERTQAQWLELESLRFQNPAALLEKGTRFILDTADEAMESSPEAALFVLQLYNLLKEQAQPGALLLLGQTPPAHWNCSLADLISRLNTLPVIPIQAPDDALMTHVLTKLLQDCQLVVPESVLTYLLRHMERSFAAARQTIAHLNELSLVEKRPVTTDLCRRLF